MKTNGFGTMRRSPWHKWPTPRGCDALREALGDIDFDVRAGAAKALGRLGDTGSVDSLIGALLDQEWSVRAAAACALGRLGDPRGVDALVEALGDQILRVRAEAAKALGQLGDARGINTLIELWRGQDWSVQSWVAKALGQLGEARGVDSLIELLQFRLEIVRTIRTPQGIVTSIEVDAKDKMGCVRAQAAKALGQIGAARSIDPLMKVLRDQDKHVRDSATKALRRIVAANGIRVPLRRRTLRQRLCMG